MDIFGGFDMVYQYGGELRRSKRKSVIAPEGNEVQNVDEEERKPHHSKQQKKYLSEPGDWFYNRQLWGSNKHS